MNFVPAVILIRKSSPAGHAAPSQPTTFAWFSNFGSAGFL